MNKTVEIFNDQLAGIHCGVISPALIDTVRIDCYDQKMPIKHLAITTCDGNRIVINPYDTSLLGAVDKSLKSAGFNSYVFSKTQVVVTFSALSGAEREKVKNQINKLAEEARVAIRNTRRKARQTKDLPEDVQEKFEKELQALTDQKIAEGNEICGEKLQALRTK